MLDIFGSEREFLRSFVGEGIEDIKVKREDDHHISKINDYLPSEYKIAYNDENRDAFYVVFNLLVKDVLNDYFGYSHNVEKKEMKHDELYYETRMYRFFNKIVYNSGSSYWDMLTIDNGYKKKSLNEAGVIAMKMYLSSIIYLQDKKIFIPLENQDDVKKHIDEKCVNYFTLY